jgi:hypothetical protein
LSGWQRAEGFLDLIEVMADWVSPRLGIRFDLSGDELQIIRPDGNPFLTYIESAQQVAQEHQRAEQAEQARLQAASKLLGMGLTLEQIADALGLSIETVQQLAQEQ